MLFVPWDTADTVICAFSIVAFIHSIASIPSELYSDFALPVVSSGIYMGFLVLVMQDKEDISRKRVHARGIVIVAAITAALIVSSGFAFAIATIFSFRSFKHAIKSVRDYRGIVIPAIAASDIALSAIWGIFTVPQTISSVEPRLSTFMWFAITALAGTKLA